MESAPSHEPSGSAEENILKKMQEAKELRARAFRSKVIATGGLAVAAAGAVCEVLLTKQLNVGAVIGFSICEISSSLSAGSGFVKAGEQSGQASTLEEQAAQMVREQAHAEMPETDAAPDTP